MYSPINAATANQGSKRPPMYGKSKSGNTTFASKGMRSNENKLSDRRREKAALRVSVLKSSEVITCAGSAVGWSDWTDDWSPSMDEEIRSRELRRRRCVFSIGQ